MVVQRKFVRYLVLVMWIAFTGITISTGYQWAARSKKFRERDDEAKTLSENSNRNARRAQAIKDSADSTASAETRASDSRRQLYWQLLGWVILTFVGAAL